MQALARGVRAWLAAAYRSRRRHRRGRNDHARAAARARLRRRAPVRLRALGGQGARRDTVEEATPEALAAGDLDLCLFSVGTSASASSSRTPSAAAPSASTSPPPTGSSRDPARRPRGERHPRGRAPRASSRTRTAARSRSRVRSSRCTTPSGSSASGSPPTSRSPAPGAQAMERLRAQTPEENDLRMDWDFDGVEFDEEEKLREETRKILELPALPVSATCVRVPILVGHAEAVWIETKEPLSRRAGDLDPRRRAGSQARAVPHPGRRRRRRRRPRRPHPQGPDDRERARALHRRRQPAQGRGAERDPDRRAPARAAARRRLILATVATALSLLAPASDAVAAGDIASCRSSGDEPTAALVARMPGTVAVLGDAVYERGTRTGVPRLLLVAAASAARTRAALGNHEYGTGHADAAIAYFRLPRAGYYSYDLGNWHVVVLNSNCRPAGGCERGSPQQRWLAADLAANPGGCTRRVHASPALQLRPARLGHDPRAALDDAQPRRRRRRPRRPRPPLRAVRAVRGHPVLRRRHRRPKPLPGALPPVRPKSVASTTDLRRPEADAPPTAYDWRFVPVAGSTYSDSGSGRCR